MADPNQQPYYSSQLGPGGTQYDPLGNYTGGLASYNGMFDPLNLAQPFINPTGYQQANLTPLEQQALMLSGGLMGQGAQGPGQFGDYLNQTRQGAAQSYGALAPEIYGQGQQLAQGAAASAAHRGISGGMAMAPQLQISDQTQRQLNALRGGLMQQAGQEAMGLRQQDVQNQLGRLKAAYEMGRYPQPKASPLSNIFSLFGSMMGGLGGGGGGSSGGGDSYGSTGGGYGANA